MSATGLEVAVTILRPVAHLIAAGRDLIEACEAALRAFQTNPMDRLLTPEEEDAIEKLRAALVKARLPELAAEILRRGPDQVVINEAGDTTTPRAGIGRGVTPDVIFIRNDGWSLGSAAHLERVAYEKFAGQWVGYVRSPSPAVRPITDYPA